MAPLLCHVQVCTRHAFAILVLFHFPFFPRPSIVSLCTLLTPVYEVAESMATSKPCTPG